MKLAICFLIGCILSVTLTITFGLSAPVAFLVGCLIGCPIRVVAVMWEDY